MTLCNRFPNDDILYGADVVVEMTRRDLNSI
jgi:hypothetical protein